LRLGRAIIVAAIASGMVLLAACRPANPPNALVAMLRAVPQIGDEHIRSLIFSDFQQARVDLAIPKDGGVSSFPAVLQATLARLSDSPLAEGSLYTIGQLEAVLEISPSGAPSSVMLVGSFDTAKARSDLESRGWPSVESGLFRLYRTPEDSGIGIGPRRLVYSPAYAVAQAITAFRGGDDSLLGFEGLQSLSLSSGRPTAFAAAPPESGCLDPRWMAVAVRYLERSAPAVAFVVQYPDPDSAQAAVRRLTAGLSSVAGDIGSTIGVVDARRDLVVSSIQTDDAGAVEWLRAMQRGSRFERALAC
jgi:hypothetical protein